MADSSYSFDSFLSFVNQNFLVLLAVGIFFVGGFFVGSIWTENQMLQGGSGGTNPSAAAPAAPNQPQAPSGPTEEQLSQMPEVTEDDYIRGSLDADIILVEYSDYECPFCQGFHPTMEQVREEYGDQVAWVYRHYPLPIHDDAQKSAEGAECVGDLAGNEAFWTYTDTIFDILGENGGTLNPEDIPAAAEATGVDMAAFTECLDSGRMADRVQEDMDGGIAAGVRGTPGTFVVTQDGVQELIGGRLPFAQVEQTLQKYL